MHRKGQQKLQLKVRDGLSVLGFGCRMEGSGFRFWGLGGLGFDRVQGLGFRLWDSGFVALG